MSCTKCDILVHLFPYPASVYDNYVVYIEAEDKDITPRTGSGDVKPRMPVTNTGAIYQESEWRGITLVAPR